MNENESIEIPFGAKNSELKGWEYTIPEGYEARIEGNKIILEPKEISLTKEIVIKVLELYRSIHRDILKKIEDCDNADIVDMGDEYVAEEIVKRYLKECINKRSEI